MKKAKKFALIVAIPVLLLVSSASIYYYIKRNGPYTLPAITLEALDGPPVALHSLLGKPSLVVFWASTCSTCVSELPSLIKLYNEYSPRGLQVVGIVIYYNDPIAASAMVKNKAIPYPILLDRNKKATYAFGGVHLTPSSFLISPEGKILYRQTGETDFVKIRELLQKTLHRS